MSERTEAPSVGAHVATRAVVELIQALAEDVNGYLAAADNPDNLSPPELAAQQETLVNITLSVSCQAAPHDAEPTPVEHRYVVLCGGVQDVLVASLAPDVEAARGVLVAIRDTVEGKVAADA